MIIDLKKCAAQPLDVNQRFDFSQKLASNPEIETIDPVEAEFRVSSVGASRFLVRGRFAATLTAYCVRCLEPFPVSLAESFTLTYMPARQRPAAGPGESAMHLGEVDVSYYEEDDRLEVIPMLEEQLHLAMPMRFLCREGCRGLCAQCGTNRNQGNCSCAEPSLESPLEVLNPLRQ